jgi:hypothetical protein
MEISGRESRELSSVQHELWSELLLLSGVKSASVVGLNELLSRELWSLRNLLAKC